MNGDNPGRNFLEGPVDLSKTALLSQRHAHLKCSHNHFPASALQHLKQSGSLCFMEPFGVKS
ncbi:hypothetical protein DBA26_10165 [Brucella canis]|nr:hypothetical protein DBA26_10165 [Brucella canis]